MMLEGNPEIGGGGRLFIILMLWLGMPALGLFMLTFRFGLRLPGLGIPEEMVFLLSRSSLVSMFCFLIRSHRMPSCLIMYSLKVFSVKP